MQTHHKYLSFAAIMIPLSGQSTSNLMPKLLSSFSLFVRQKEEETKMTRVTFCCEHAPYLHSISTSTGLVAGSWPIQQPRKSFYCGQSLVDKWMDGWCHYCKSRCSSNGTIIIPIIYLTVRPLLLCSADWVAEGLNTKRKESSWYAETLLHVFR